MRSSINMDITIPIIFVVVHMAMVNTVFAEVEKELENMKTYLHTVTQQVMLQQFFAEQRTRSEGQSGIIAQRLRRGGTKNYFTESHSGYTAAAVHDHANNIRTVGMGEFTAVLNGIEFTTRHNDYRLFMPHRTSSEYHATEPIPLPLVPQAVLSKQTIQEQVDEMREWFKAWRDQDHSDRDYRKYFKPILCYLEGAWTKVQKNVNEPFVSDRHFLDAKTWIELHQKIMFTSYSGSKSIRENFAFLPTKIIEMINDTIPVFAQWNYRILCHPIKRDIPLDRLRIVEDLSSRMMTERDIYKHKHSRAARFQFNSKNSDKFEDRPTNYEFLDELMEEIPGKDNYAGHLFDKGLEAEVLNYNGSIKDVSRYHRWFKTEGRDAMGTSNMHRGYNDHMLFAAMTTQNKIAGVTVSKCLKRRKKKRQLKICKNIHQKWTYAIPLEIIYLTPLSSWNPYDLEYHGEYKRGNTVTANGRRGSCQDGKNQEYNGTNSKVYYITPDEFFTGGQVGKAKTDTARKAVCILDKTMVSRKVRASGTHVFLPYIKDVGIMRQRYPNFPVHGEGSSIWKEVNALREFVMDQQKWGFMKWTYESIKPTSLLKNTQMEMGLSNHVSVSKHTHTVELSAAEISQCKGGQDVYKTSSSSNGHQHILRVRYNRATKKFMHRHCDGKNMCWDRHNRVFTVINN